MAALIIDTLDSLGPRAGRWKALLLALLLCIGHRVVALQPDSDSLSVRVVDVGPGLCCVVAIPHNHFMIYDAGNYQDQGKSAIKAIRDVVPAGSEIDLLVLSHSDSDHLAAVPAICKEYTVKRVLRDGFERDSNTWKDADAAVREESRNEGCEDINLKTTHVAPGTSYQLGPATATFVCGFYDLPDDWEELNEAEAVNARSIVVRLVFGSTSVLFCGDTVGRHIGDSDDTCIAAEKYMVDHKDDVTIDSDVMIAPHHGADNASTPAFIQAVSPEYVIFSAGHRFQHPREDAADRYLQNGVTLERIFRTDLHDNEGGEEWSFGAGNTPHRIGTRDIEIGIKNDGAIEVSYVTTEDAPAARLETLSATLGRTSELLASKARSKETASEAAEDSSRGSSESWDLKSRRAEPEVIDAYVVRNGSQVHEAGLGDTLNVTLKNMPALLATAKEQQKQIILFLDGCPVKNLVAYLPGPPADGQLQFALARDEDSRDLWTHLLGRPCSHLRPTSVSVGTQDNPPIHSTVDEGKFALIVFSTGWLLVWFLIFLAILILFLVLAAKSDLLRDIGLQPGNGARRPFSLARTQMAWWFFLVLGAYLLIGLLTGDFATSVTGSALVLLGISAATTLGAAAVDASKQTSFETQKAAATAAALQQRLIGANAALGVAPNAAQQAAVAANSADIESQLRAARNASRGFFWDILGDADGVNFHRFQLAGWTLILGVIFAFAVWRDLAMPSFNETLLALMGITSGAYLGLKIPETSSPTLPPGPPPAAGGP